MKLFDHQQKLVDQFPKKHVLCWSTGSGKSITLISLAQKAKENPLIVVPKGLKKQWQVLIAEHNLKAAVITKEEFRRDWESLDRFNCVILDELHYFLGMKSSLSKSLIAYIKKWNVEYLYGATATPFRSSAWDIYRLLEIFGRKINYFSFFQTFFFNIKMGMRTIPKAKKGDDIDQKLISLIRSVGSTVKLEDCFDVPEQTHEVIWVEATKEQKKAIETQDALLPIVRYGNEHQIIGGVLKEDDYRPIQYFESQKVEVLLGLIADNSKIIVACKYRAEIEMLKDIIGKENPELHIGIIHGDIDNRHEVLRECESKQQYVLLVAAQCAEGWEMKECPVVVFYSHDWALKNYIQFLGRVQRAGSLKKNTYISIVCKDTIDESVYTTVVKEKAEFHYEIYANKND
jgi:superfamily II DNA or RNA helicase